MHISNFIKAIFLLFSILGDAFILTRVNQNNLTKVNTKLFASRNVDDTSRDYVQKEVIKKCEYPRINLLEIPIKVFFIAIATIVFNIVIIKYSIDRVLCWIIRCLFIVNNVFAFGFTKASLILIFASFAIAISVDYIEKCSFNINPFPHIPKGLLTSKEYSRMVYHEANHFSVMVLGAKGLGKTTFLNNLLVPRIANKIYKFKKGIEAKGITEKYIYLNKENKDVIKFNLVDVPGFKETNNISEYLNTISNYIDGRNSPARLNGQQNQLDACLYFLSPHNNCLSEIDKIIMLTIHKKVNIIPIIAKTDIMKFDSIPLVKASIGYDLTANDIETYCFDKQNTGTKTNEPYGIYSHEFFEVAQLIIRHRVMRKNGLRTLPYMYHKEEKQINNYYQLRHHLISTDMLNLIKTTKDKIDLQKNQSFETYGTDSMELLTEDSNSRGRSLEYILRK